MKQIAKNKLQLTQYLLRKYLYVCLIFFQTLREFNILSLLNITVLMESAYSPNCYEQGWQEKFTQRNPE